MNNHMRLKITSKVLTIIRDFLVTHLIFIQFHLLFSQFMVVQIHLFINEIKIGKKFNERQCSGFTNIQFMINRKDLKYIAQHLKTIISVEKYWFLTESQK